MSEHDDRFDGIGADEPARDELDGLLRAWHDQNRQRAAAGRDRLVAALAAAAHAEADGASETDAGREGEPARAEIVIVTKNAEKQEPGEQRRPIIAVIRRVAMHRMSHLAAALLALAVLLPFILPGSQPQATANVLMCPEGGRLVAFAPDGETLGPCELKHTDVNVDIAGPFARITLRQAYHNPHSGKIEAVYTFPMSHRAAVDRMKMVIGDRVIEGEVKERALAQQIYAAARAAGRVTSLLEQERPNIFTQSVANIEPGAEIQIEISYVEVLPKSEGEYTFSFPTTVAPRYIPGRPSGSAADEAVPLPAAYERREGLVLLAPAAISITGVEGHDAPDRALLSRALHAHAVAIEPPPPLEYDHELKPTHLRAGHWLSADGRLTFDAKYTDGRWEPGVLFSDGTGYIGSRAGGGGERSGGGGERSGGGGGRWFWLPPRDSLAPAADEEAEAGGFSADTDQVPDAARITPMPVHPSTRAGHDVSITVNIDTGGPGILNLHSELHEIVRTEARFREDGVPRRATVKLKNLAEIPNRDFVLSWKQTADGIEDQTFAAAGGGAKGDAGFFTLLLQPPQRVADEQAVPRELLFVLDVSGSMKGQPIEKAKDVLTRALASMRPQDRFNIIKFNNATSTLWNAPRAATEANFAAARAYFDQEPGGGGTEMMGAIRAALAMPRGEPASEEGDEAAPLRLIVLLSDGEIGNDMAVLDAVKAKPADTRFFTFSIGNSANRYLLDSMARLGGGKAAYVLQTTDAAAVADAFARRINTPVLTNVKVEFQGVQVSETFPPLEAIGDLYDVEPLVMHGRFEVARLSEPGEAAEDAPARIIISGMSGAGPWRKVIPFPQAPKANAAAAREANPPHHDQLATLWARAKVEFLLNQDLAGAQQGTIAAELKDQIVSLGERFNLLTQYTAFVAVDKLRITVGGEPRLVHVPIELANDATWEGYFGNPRPILPPRATDGLTGFQIGRGAAAPQAASDSDRDQFASERIEAAREQFALQNYDDGVRILDELLVIDPTNPSALLMKDIGSDVLDYHRYHEIDRADAAGQPGDSARVVGLNVRVGSVRAASDDQQLGYRALTRSGGRGIVVIDSANTESFIQLEDADAPDAMQRRTRLVHVTAADSDLMRMLSWNGSLGGDTGSADDLIQWADPQALQHAEFPSQIELESVLQAGEAADRLSYFTTEGATIEAAQEPGPEKVVREQIVEAIAERSRDAASLYDEAAGRQAGATTALQEAQSPPAEASASNESDHAANTPEAPAAVAPARSRKAAPAESRAEAPSAPAADPAATTNEHEEATASSSPAMGYASDALDEDNAEQAEPASSPLLPAIERTAAKIRALAAASDILNANTDVGAYWAHPAFAPTLIAELHIGGESPMLPGAPHIAAAFAAHFAALYPTDEIIAQLHAAYQDDTLDQAALTAKVQDLADRSWERIRRLERLATLQHRLDPRLFPIVAAADDQTLKARLEGSSSLAEIAAGLSLGEEVRLEGDGLVLSILVEDVATSKKALQKAGAVISASDAKSGLVIATVPLQKLAEVTLLDGVRRVEPAMIE